MKPPANSLEQRRLQMVDLQLLARDITDLRVLEAMRRIPRHLFVSEDLVDEAYNDHPLPIGLGQTISQPYIVAMMAQLAEVSPDDRVLDIGTGCGYQAAVLSLLAKEVISIELHRELAKSAAERLSRLGYENVHVRRADGFEGLTEYAPYDAIICAAAPASIPTALYEQLAIGGRLVIPVGNRRQSLVLVRRESTDDYVKRNVAPVAFVPMVRAGSNHEQV